PSILTSKFYASSISVKRFICVSSNQADNMRNHDVFSKCLVISNGLEKDNFINLQQKEFDTVTFVGAISEDKGLHWLLQIWPEVINAFPNAKLQIIGNAKLYSRNNKMGKFGFGSEEFESKYVVPIYGNNSESLTSFNIFPLGLCSPKQIIYYLSKSLIGVVNPNFSYKMAVETFCVSAIEIQACKTVVLGGNVGGLLDTVLNGKTGYLCNSQFELRDKLIWCLKNTQKSVEMGELGKQFVESKFDFENLFPKWEMAINDVILDRSVKIHPINFSKVEFRVLLKELIRMYKKFLHFIS
ncbi:MAG: glycosyltransferase, partial [Cytophagales bacterium]|nr:glycosyltransferase [Cytophagales bacterium]